MYNSQVVTGHFNCLNLSSIQVPADARVSSGRISRNIRQPQGYSNPQSNPQRHSRWNECYWMRMYQTDSQLHKPNLVPFVLQTMLAICIAKETSYSILRWWNHFLTSEILYWIPRWRLILVHTVNHVWMLPRALSLLLLYPYPFENKYSGWQCPATQPSRCKALYRWCQSYRDWSLLRRSSFIYGLEPSRCIPVQWGCIPVIPMPTLSITAPCLRYRSQHSSSTSNHNNWQTNLLPG